MLLLVDGDYYYVHVLKHDNGHGCDDDTVNTNARLTLILQLMRRASQRRAAQAKESGKALQKDGVVSVTLVEGQKLIAMDDNGESKE